MPKGLELDLVGTMIIALVGIGILILFVSGTMKDSVNDGFCYLTQKIGVTISWCKPLGIPSTAIDLSPRTTEDLAVELAGRSIKCWQDAVKPQERRNVVCWELFLQTHPGKLTENDLTSIMEEQGGCSVLQNYMIVDEGGNSIEYEGDCGDQDQIDWKIYGNVLENQSFIKIEYDTDLNKIVIKG